jgi:two-component system CheB/CheR fusion protein
VRTFTPAATGIFSLIATDRGRPLTDIVSNLELGDLAHDVREVIDSGRAVERTVTRRDDSVHYVMRVLPYRDQGDAITGALVTFVDVTEPVRAAEQQRVLVHELNHRVRNMLSVVSAIASQTLARATSPESFVASFFGRIQSLARSHGLLAEDQWRDVELARVLAVELEPYHAPDDGRISLEGPRLRASPKAALALGLVAHELATNAVKHGALSVPEGRVAVSWSVEEESGEGDPGRLVLRWSETGGPAPPTAGGPGFGTQLIERAVRHELGGTLATDLTPEGFRLVLQLPVGSMLTMRGAGTHGPPGGD